MIASNVVGLGLIVGILVTSVDEAQKILEQEVREEEAEKH